MEDFDLFWELFSPDEQFNNRRSATWREWQKKSEKSRQAMIEWLQQQHPPKNRNPYFFVQDFREPRQQTLSYADYYARYGTTEERDGWKMENPTGQKVVYVKTLSGCSRKMVP